MTPLTITLAGAFVRLLILGFLAMWVYTMFRDAPTINDDDMEMSLVMLAIPKSVTFFWLPLAVGLFACTVVMGILITVSSWPLLKEHFRTGKMIDRY